MENGHICCVWECSVCFTVFCVYDACFVIRYRRWEENSAEYDSGDDGEKEDLLVV